MDNEYQFLSRWQVEGTCGEVADILGDPLALPRWWPSVYLRVDELRPPDAARAGTARPAAYTKGWLPYTLRVGVRGRRLALPGRLHAHRERRFRRAGRVDVRQDGAFVDITYDWRLRAEKPLLRQLSFLLKPLFEANHRWAMAQGEESLRLELARRRASSDAARARDPAAAGADHLRRRGARRRRGGGRSGAGVPDAAPATTRTHVG